MFITNTTKKTVDLPFELIKSEILGKDYNLSLVLCSNKLALKMNLAYRNKNYTPNTLSFPYSDESGEIIINLQKAKDEAGQFNHSYAEHIVFLFIHSLLHLKGYTHGYKMEKAEREYMLKFVKGQNV